MSTRTDQVRQSLQFAVGVMIDPQETFWHIKNRGSLVAALVIMAFALAIRVTTIFTTSFHYSSAEPWEVNFIAEVVRMIVPWISFVVANYAVTTILYGEGTFRQIFIASAYCFVPYVVFALPLSLLTNVLTLGERGLVDGAMTLIYVWIGILFVLNVKVTHQYETSGAVGVCALTLLAMLALWSAVAVVYGLTDQFAKFVGEIVMELRLRG